VLPTRLFTAFYYKTLPLNPKRHLEGDRVYWQGSGIPPASRTFVPDFSAGEYTTASFDSGVGHLCASLLIKSQKEVVDITTHLIAAIEGFVDHIWRIEQLQDSNKAKGFTWDLLLIRTEPGGRHSRNVPRKAVPCKIRLGLSRSSSRHSIFFEHLLGREAKDHSFSNFNLMCSLIKTDTQAQRPTVYCKYCTSVTKAWHASRSTESDTRFYLL
jgi:hypothetical protein